KSGQASVIQIASPYELGVAGAPEDQDDTDARTSQSLANWMARLIARYPDEGRTWRAASDGTDGAAVEADRVHATHDPRLDRLLGVLQRIVIAKADNGQRSDTIDYAAVLTRIIQDMVTVEMPGVDTSAMEFDEFLNFAAGMFNPGGDGTTSGG
ncbi:MAG: hypothetical protein KDD77_06000, partial [Caldilineaceae bacterium]|nr:hypothetical protein [Caldilineaceae bacterium]